MRLPTTYLNIIIFSSTAFLTSCANITSVSTNLDEENFREYFAPSHVKIYQHENEIKAKYTLVGIVEGEDCQEKSFQAPPDKVIARTAARRVAYNMGANAIVFTECAELLDSPNAQCNAMVICYGTAYNVIEATENNASNE